MRIGPANSLRERLRHHLQKINAKCLKTGAYFPRLIATRKTNRLGRGEGKMR